MTRLYTVLNRIFSFVCTLTTAVLTGICFHKFTLNDDLAQIDFPTYHQQSHAIYPTLTLCFMGPTIFVDENLGAYGRKGFNSTSYWNFLRGVQWVDEMIDINFDEVTFDIEDYLEAISISSSANQTIYKQCSENFELVLEQLMGYKCSKTNNGTKSFYISYKDHQTKCFSLNIPFDKGNKVQRLRLFIKSSIFPKELHESFKFDENFGIFVHYPQQLFRAPIHKLYQKVKNDSILSVLNIKVVNMEVLRRRNKQTQQCNDEWNDDDGILENLISYFVRIVGCKPPHWQTYKKENTCANQSQLKKVNYLPSVSWIPYLPSMGGIDDLPPPCQDILEINYEYTETNWNKAEFEGLDVNTDFFEVELAFPSSTYKEIIHVKAYDGESLMGYVGGYIGMFLGLGLLQVPELLFAAHKKLKQNATNSRKLNPSRNRSNEIRHENGIQQFQSNNHTKHVDKKQETKHEESDIWSIKNEIQRPSVLGRIDILEAKLEQVLVENRALIQYISNSESIDKKKLQNEILL